jgi:hypothetical protein
MSKFEIGKKRASPIAEPLDGSSQFALTHPGNCTGPFNGTLDIPRELLDSVRADAVPEILSGDVFELVSLIDDCVGA